MSDYSKRYIESSSSVTFETTTKNVERFFTDRLKTLVTKDGDTTIKNVKLTVSTLNVSDIFKPFVLLLSNDALSEPRGSSPSEKGNFDDIFLGESERNRPVWVKEPIFKFIIKPFSYLHEDIEQFKSQRVRSELGINFKTYETLRSGIYPKMFKKYIMVILDPIRIFHYLSSMVEPKPTTDRYIIKILRTTKISDDNWKYTICRENVQFNPENNDISREIVRMIESKTN